MTGYCAYSKSNNAIEAERSGIFPVSHVSKTTKVPSVLIKRFVSPKEWHHVSGWYNTVDYYSVLEVFIVFGKINDAKEYIEENEECYDSLEDYDVNPAAVDALSKFKSIKKETKTFKNCKVKWIEWSGTRRHPRAIEYAADNATIIDDGGAFVKVVLKNGETFRKKKDAKGFSFIIGVCDETHA